MKAARSGKLWAVRRLLSFGANVNVRDRNDETALHYACRQGSTEILSMLIKAGARLNAQNQIGLTPMMEAVSYNQREAVSLLVKQRDLDLYKRDFCTGDTALHIAVKKNYIHMVEILLQAGNWYIEYNYNNLGESFVHDVVVYNRLELLRLFLAYNYDFDRPAKRFPPSLIGGAFTKSVYNSIPSTSVGSQDSSSNEAPCASASTSSCCGSLSYYSGVPGNSRPNSMIFEKSPFQLALERGHLDMARILADVGCFRIRLPLNSNSSSHSPHVTTSPTSLSPTRAVSPNGLSQSSSHSHWTGLTGISMSSPLARRYSGLLEVKSLKKWCRRVIRQTLGFRLIEALPQLPLPVPLKDFLLLRDLDWSVCLSSSLMNQRSVTDNGDLAIIVPPRCSSSLTPQ
ncbi:Ankyrin repeat domain-containing protein 6 [Fasciola gigantica]|uniref:Ankyrin repeat domain-containing protein 6 n=1 Tax=Fasciola gigantica TaxID=46835 RepID=A0A504Y8I6_FASGI|nr:Ankyrin repeat domain-containing protein 6 [Fasciola gigantica]